MIPLLLVLLVRVNVAMELWMAPRVIVFVKLILKYGINTEEDVKKVCNLTVKSGGMKKEMAVY